MVQDQTAPPRTDWRSRLQAPGIVPEAVRFRRPAPTPKVTKMVTVGALLMALISSLVVPSGGVALDPPSTVEQLKPAIGSDGLTGPPDAAVPPNEATIALEPQALSLTTHIAEDPTAASIDDRQEASLQLLPESSLAPSVAMENPDGRRRRRLGRKRKRRPLQDEYWPPEGKPDDNGPEANAGGGGGRLSERKRLPYAGATASRWEGINKLPTAHGRLARPEHQQPFRSGHHRANDWMHNPYTDAVSVEQQQTGATRRPYVAPAAASSAVGGNFSPIDPNRPRRISSNGGGRPTEPSAMAATANSNPKAYRKPYSQARRSEEQFSAPEGSAESTGSSAADLKALLKQSDGLSLSEILQQRNISLQDLIKGKQMALAALTQSPPVDAATVTPGEPVDTMTTTVSPTLSSVRFRVYDDAVTIVTTTGGPSSTVQPRPMATALAEDETNNSVDELDGQGVSIFPTVEIKQLALNPVLPVLKEETRLRPIKGVASRIRPDLSNTHIRTSEPARYPPLSGVKRLPPSPPAAQASSTTSVALGEENASPSTTTTTTTTTPTLAPVPSNPTVPSLLLITSTAREKWTPSASLVGQRQRQTSAGSKQQQQQQQASSTPEPPTAKELERLGSAEATSMLPEAEAMVELAPDRGHYQHHQLLRVPKQKARIAIKPKLTNVVPPTTSVSAKPTTTTTTTVTTTTSTNPPPPTGGDRFNLSDVELGDDVVRVNASEGGQSRRQQRLNNANGDDDDDEPELNIIEKFTSFAEQPSASLEGKPAADDDGEMADLIGRISEHTQRSFTDSLEEFYRDVTESNPSLFNDLAPIASSDDRRELLELMEDRRIGARLAKVLSQRNMTLEQLLEHRRRGSSQLHLAEIVAGKVKPIDDKIDIVTAFEHFPRFNIGNLRSIRPDDIKQDSQGFSYFTSIINLRPAEDGHKEGRARALPSPRHRGASTAGNHRNEAHFLASGGSKARLLVPSRMSATGVYGSSSGSSSNYEDDARRENGVEEHDLLDLELSGHGFQHHRSASVTIESTPIPVGVRSAIVASSAIVGVSLAIFVAIFVTCRLRQRRRQKLNYTENFHMAKGRLPIIHSAELEARKSTADRSSPGSAGEQVVYTTHRALGGGASTSATDAGTARGRQQQQQQQQQQHQSAMMDPNSVEVQDYLWDRKPFQ